MARIAILATSLMFFGLSAAQAASVTKMNGMVMAKPTTLAKPNPNQSATTRKSSFARPTGREKFGIAIENKPARSRMLREQSAR
jgi:hypothetical protein